MSCDLLPTLAGDRLICLVEYDELTVPTKALLNGLRDFQSLDQLIQDHRVHIDYRDALRAIYSLAPNGEFSEPCLKLCDLEKVIPPYVSLSSLIKLFLLMSNYLQSNAVVWFMIYDLVTKKVIPRLEVLDNRWNAMVKFNRIHGIGKIRARALYVVSWDGYPDDILMKII